MRKFVDVRQDFRHQDQCESRGADLDTGRLTGHRRAARLGVIKQVCIQPWLENNTERLEPVEDRLLANVTELHSRIEALTFPPEEVAGGAAVLMEEVAFLKNSGEENRRSRTDPWDLTANIQGSYQIVNLVRSLIAGIKAEFSTIGIPRSASDNHRKHNGPKPRAAAPPRDADHPRSGGLVAGPSTVSG
ncbi:imelysin family protein [Pseudogemmobacter sonorensis]|uniref:imelysin family protein n=1 Tax=Pseudogemmobacter sonorensis TaxID=2989681 RepID=UPI0036A48F62